MMNFMSFSIQSNINEKVMNENCKAAVELVKNRMEKDNISVILIRTS